MDDFIYILHCTRNLAKGIWPTGNFWLGSKFPLNLKGIKSQKCSVVLVDDDKAGEEVEEENNVAACG